MYGVVSFSSNIGPNFVAAFTDSIVDIIKIDYQGWCRQLMGREVAVLKSGRSRNTQFKIRPVTRAQQCRIQFMIPSLQRWGCDCTNYSADQHHNKDEDHYGFI